MELISQPFGWFQVAWSDEIGPSKMVVRRAFDQEWVVWRSAASTLSVFAAHCPHMGAHLGVGGVVEDDCLVCPMHGWRWNHDGQNVAIAGSDRVNRRTQVESLPVAEVDGAILVWFSTTPRPPLWEPASPDPLPAASELGAHAGSTRVTRVVHAPWQEIAEGSVDAAHVGPVHGAGRPVKVTERSFEEHRWWSRSLVMDHPQSEVTVGQMRTMHLGPGFGCTRFDAPGITAAVTGSTLPLDDRSCEVRLTVSWAATSADFGDGFAAEVVQQIDEDVPIWENKIYVANPPLSDVDGPILAFRRWAKNFDG